MSDSTEASHLLSEQRIHPVPTRSGQKQTPASHPSFLHHKTTQLASTSLSEFTQSADCISDNPVSKKAVSQIIPNTLFNWKQNKNIRPRAETHSFIMNVKIGFKRETKSWEKLNAKQFKKQLKKQPRLIGNWFVTWLGIKRAYQKGSNWDTLLQRVIPCTPSAETSAGRKRHTMAHLTTQ